MYERIVPPASWDVDVRGERREMDEDRWERMYGTAYRDLCGMIDRLRNLFEDGMPVEPAVLTAAAAELKELEQAYETVTGSTDFPFTMNIARMQLTEMQDDAEDAPENE